ncbi:MAG: hypothetical protein FWC20_00560 [Oscillospiraceae bacterium]|nr:hypothetical protein [Oscillospiraceae bacterium]MCL2277884.1 hypothetical protein [Oscillospiraceae bacterium]
MGRCRPKKQSEIFLEKPFRTDKKRTATINRLYIFIVSLLLLFLPPLLAIQTASSEVFWEFFKNGSLLIGSSVLVIGAAWIELINCPSSLKSLCVVPLIAAALFVALSGSQIYNDEHVMGLIEAVPSLIISLLFFIITWIVMVGNPKNLLYILPHNINDMNGNE